MTTNPVCKECGALLINSKTAAVCSEGCGKLMPKMSRSQALENASALRGEKKEITRGGYKLETDHALPLKTIFIAKSSKWKLLTKSGSPAGNRLLSDRAIEELSIEWEWDTEVEADQAIEKITKVRRDRNVKREKGEH